VPDVSWAYARFGALLEENLARDWQVTVEVALPNGGGDLHKISADSVLSGSFDYGEVAPSVLIAIVASYARLTFWDA
jgi:hypothetical protein